MTIGSVCFGSSNVIAPRGQETPYLIAQKKAGKYDILADEARKEGKPGKAAAYEALKILELPSTAGICY